MTPAQTKKCIQYIIEVQMMLGDLPKGKALKAYNRMEKVKGFIRRSQLKEKRL